MPTDRRPPLTDRRVRVIFNPDAGRKGGIPTNIANPEEHVRDLMRRFGLGDDLVVSASEDDGVAAARDAVAQGIGTVVAAGGDGTVHGIGRELTQTGTALGILPLGSVMNVARMLDIPRDLDDAARMLAAARDAGSVRLIDLGRAGDLIFFEAGSVGLNAVVFREASRIDRGTWHALFSAVWLAFRYRPARLTIRTDSRQLASRALMVTVSNGPYTGIGFTVAPDADLEDDQFDITVFRRFSRWELFRHFRTIAFGHHRYTPRAETFRARSVEITSVHPLPARADSTDLGTTPVRFEVIPAALRVLTPVRESA